MNTLFIYAPRTVDLLRQPGCMCGGFGWGVGGAAFASGLSTAIVACLFLMVVFRKKSPVQINLKQRYRFGPPVPAGRLEAGPARRLGALHHQPGPDRHHRLDYRHWHGGGGGQPPAVTAESISYLPASGVAVAGTTLVGQAIGAGRKDLAQRFARTVSWMGIVIMTFGGSILFFFAPQLL